MYLNVGKLGWRDTALGNPMPFVPRYCGFEWFGKSPDESEAGSTRSSDGSEDLLILRESACCHFSCVTLILSSSNLRGFGFGFELVLTQCLTRIDRMTMLTVWTAMLGLKSQ